MTPDEIAAIINTSAFNTPELLTELFGYLGRQKQLQVLDIQIIQLNDERQKVTYPIEQKRVELQAQRDALAAEINPPKA